MVKKYQVYGLVDPVSLRIRYVGRTVQSLRARLNKHLAAKRTAHVTSWITGLKRQGLDPVIVLLEVTAPDFLQLCAAERWWIAYGRASGWDLVNHTKGGDGQPPDRVNTLSANQKTAAALKGRTRTEEHRKKLSAAHSTPEMIAANKARHIGRKRSQSTRDKIGAASRARITTPEARENMSKAQLQREPRTEEFREKCSRAHKGKKFSAEHVANMAASRRGKKASPETRAKMREAHIRRWAAKKAQEAEED